MLRPARQENRGRHERHRRAVQAREAYASTCNQGDRPMPPADDDVKARIEHVDTGKLDEVT